MAHADLVLEALRSAIAEHGPYQVGERNAFSSRWLVDIGHCLLTVQQINRVGRNFGWFWVRFPEDQLTVRVCYDRGTWRAMGWVSVLDAPPPEFRVRGRDSLVEVWGELIRVWLYKGEDRRTWYRSAGTVEEIQGKRPYTEHPEVQVAIDWVLQRR